MLKITPEHYFECSYQSFLEREKELSSAQEKYLSIANGLIVRLKFAGQHMVEPFIRALAHLLTDPVENPDLTICIWDNSPSENEILLVPFEYDPESTGRHMCGNLHVACERWPPRTSLYSAERKLALFCISDMEKFPWYERCRPLRTILHWWARQHGWYMAHAACIGTSDGGIALTGPKGAGKSTTALAALYSDLFYLADDLCLLGFENAQPVAYSVHTTGKLEGFDKLPELEKHVFNQRRNDDEKAYFYVNECFPEKMLRKLPLVAIVVPTITEQQNSELVPISVNEAFHVLAGSSNTELKASGAGNFFVPYKLCKTVPCYRLKAGSDPEALKHLLRDVIDQSSLAAVGR